MLFMADDTTLAVLRRQLEVQLAGRASLVTALHGMLEVIPLGASKAVGLQRVLAMLGVHEAAVLAAGDGTSQSPAPSLFIALRCTRLPCLLPSGSWEKGIEMLQMCSPSLALDVPVCMCLSACAFAALWMVPSRNVAQGRTTLRCCRWPAWQWRWATPTRR